MKNQSIKVLIVDDDTFLGGELTEGLNKRGYSATYLSSVSGITEAIRNIQPDILVFDVEIGRENGIEMARNLYDGNPTLPIIFISSHHSEDLKVEGLNAGALAYLDKPFSVRLLAAHIDRYTQEKNITSADNENLITMGNALLDVRNRTIIAENGEIKELRPMEFNIFRKLALNINQIVSRDDILFAAWEGQVEYYNNQSLNNYIRRLRNKIKDNTNLEIEGFRGLGYKLRVIED